MRALASLELFHSRPIAPTRRVALGTLDLPTDPAPGPGGVLLGAIVASSKDFLDDELLIGLQALTLQVQEGVRIVQPRLRHRFQDDRVGLTRSTYRLVTSGDRLDLDFEHKGSGLQAILGAVYAAGTLPAAGRRAAMDAVRKGLAWGAAVDEALFRHLSGLDRGRRWSADVYRDPVQWALDILGIDAERNGSVHLPTRSVIQRRFRELLRDAHPDHGGVSDEAAQRIGDLTEARKILLHR